MKKFSLFAALILGACASGEDVVLRPLPAATEPSTEVTVIRARSVIAAEFPFYIVIDGQPVFDLRNVENTRLRMSSGRQTFVIRCLGGPLSKPYEARLQYDFPPQGSVYLAVEPKGDCAEIRPVDAKTAAPLLRTTRYRAIGTVNPAAQAYGDAPAVFGPALPAGAATAAVPAAGTVSAMAPSASGANEQVAAATAAWIEAFNSRDVARMASLYDADAVLRDTAGQRIAVGPGAIAEYFRSAKTPGKVSIGEQQIRVFGDTAVDAGSNTLGRYNIVYRNRDGKWLIIDHNTSR